MMVESRSRDLPVERTREPKVADRQDSAAQSSREVSAAQPTVSLEDETDLC